MPPAVREEVAMAFGMETLVLPLVETGVRTDGMFGNFATSVAFDRAGLTANDTLAKIIRAISTFKDRINGRDSAESPRGLYSEKTTRLLSLEEIGGTYTWVNETSKRLRFDGSFSGPLLKRSRPGYHVPAAAGSAPMAWETRVTGGTQPFTITPTVLALSGHTLDLELNIDPPPVAGDMLEFTTKITSPDLNPIEVTGALPRMIQIDGRDYGVTDGMVPLEQTRLLTQQWRFPPSYGLRLNDLKTFVATFSFATDFIAKEELMRASVKQDSFSGNLVIDMTVKNPLMRHMYGLAWNPPKVRVAS